MPLKPMGAKPPKLHFPLEYMDPCNTLIPRPTPLIIPNRMQIHSAILPQYICGQTDRQTHRLTDMFHHIRHLCLPRRV